MSLSEQIKNFRKGRAKLTQPELAEKAKVGKSLIINLEKGHSHYPANIDKIVEAMGAKILIIGKDDEFFVKPKE